MDLSRLSDVFVRQACVAINLTAVLEARNAKFQRKQFQYVQFLPIFVSNLAFGVELRSKACFATISGFIVSFRNLI